jgi:hypothetical protein
VNGRTMLMTVSGQTFGMTVMALMGADGREAREASTLMTASGIDRRTVADQGQDCFFFQNLFLIP